MDCYETKNYTTGRLGSIPNETRSAGIEAVFL